METDRKITFTVQLRGKLTLASESLASATAYTRECERCHSRISVECSRVLHPSLACYSRVLLASASRVLARSRFVLLASARPLARVRVSCECWKLTGQGPCSARRGKLIRPPSLALHVCKQAIARPPRFRCFALALRASALSVSLLCTRCSGIRVLFSEPPCFFSEPAPRYLLRAPCSLLSLLLPRSESLVPRLLSALVLRAGPALSSLESLALCSRPREPRSRGALASYSARTRECERSHSRNTRVCERSHSRSHSRVRALVLAHFPKTLACESHLTRE